MEKAKEDNRANKLKWYQKLLIILAIIVFSPLIILGIIIAGIYILCQIPKNKKEYQNSRYYTDFNQKFTMSNLYSPEYRFYNSAVRRELPMQYIKQESNGLEYFILNETIYLFPDFDQIDLDEEETNWQADYDGDWKNFNECYANLLAKLETTYDYPIKLLVERKMFPILNLNDITVPDCIFITWNYENAFENEDSPLKMIIPQNSKQLYDMMHQTPDLCGKFELSDDEKNIVWMLYENIKIEIAVDSQDCYFGISEQLLGKNEIPITHWHPTMFEIYNEVYKVGKRGNVLVLRSIGDSGAFLYSGSKKDCPYSPDKKHLSGKYYYLEAI